jgi:hypothetical protein
MTQLISTMAALPLTWQCSVVWEARDPVTSDLVSGVIVNNPTLYGLNLTDTGYSPSLTSTIPLLTPIDFGDGTDDTTTDTTDSG